MTLPSESDAGQEPARPRLWSPEPESAATPESVSEPVAVALPHTGPAARVRRGRVKRERKAAVLTIETPATPSPTPRYSPTIMELPPDDRPRERLYACGVGALTTAELIGILIRAGTRERSAVSLGEHLLAHFGNIKEIACAPVEQLSEVKGIGKAKAAEIKAAIELGNRLALYGEDARPIAGSPRDIANLIMPDLRYLKKETLKSLLLDTKNRVIAIKTVSIGDLTSSIANPREIFKDAVVASAASIIMAHNHPSGDPTPSQQDIEITQRLIDTGKIIGIDVLDHVIIGDGKFVSLKERGLM